MIITTKADPKIITHFQIEMEFALFFNILIIKNKKIMCFFVGLQIYIMKILIIYT